LPSSCFAGADLRGATLRKAALPRCNLAGANLSGACLEQTILFEALLTTANLEGADLNQADLGHANVAAANLNRANLRGADLYEADLSGANLTGADLREAKLTETNLTGTDLTRANLTGAEVTKAQLARAKSIEDVTLPSGITTSEQERESRRRLARFWGASLISGCIGAVVAIVASRAPPWQDGAQMLLPGLMVSVPETALQGLVMWITRRSHPSVGDHLPDFAIGAVVVTYAWWLFTAIWLGMHPGTGSDLTRDPTRDAAVNIASFALWLAAHLVLCRLTVWSKIREEEA
jgi:hypothetical protein